MDSTISISLSPAQIWISFLIQAWLVVIFPVIVIRKLNHLTQLLENQGETDRESA